MSAAGKENEAAHYTQIAPPGKRRVRGQCARLRPSCLAHIPSVMPGPDPGIQLAAALDCRVKPGNDKESQ
jgi:hypothetical protein